MPIADEAGIMNACPANVNKPKGLSGFLVVLCQSSLPVILY